MFWRGMSPNPPLVDSQHFLSPQYQADDNLSLWAYPTWKDNFCYAI